MLVAVEAVDQHLELVVLVGVALVLVQTKLDLQLLSMALAEEAVTG
jgi:hypothetical protein